MPADFFVFLSSSVDLLKGEAPENFSRLAREMDGLRAGVSANGIRKHVYFRGDRLALDEESAEEEPREHDIEVALTDRAILNLIDGKCSLQQSVVQGEIHIKGESVVLNRYYRCLSHYLDGALRSASFPKLLSQYRSAVSSSG
jgi:hypothetical protein